MNGVLQKLADGVHLTFDEAYELCRAIVDNEISDVVKSAVLMGLRVKGETADEIAGFAKAMREKSVKVNFPDAIDTCGTGGDGKGTFNISTASALVVASLGVPVAKHGNRAVSSSVGSADILEKLGIKIQLSPDEVLKWLSEFNFAFLFAPAFHPAMKNVMPVRRELGIRTIFNLLGPITNPAGVKRQVIGVFSPDFARKIAQALLKLGVQKVLVVWGAGGIDEFSPEGENLVIEVSEGKSRELHLSPEDLGGERGKIDEIVVEPSKALDVFVDVIEGREKGPIENAVCMNCALALYVAGRADNFTHGYRLAREAIRSGKVAKLVEKMRKASEEA